MNIIKRLISPSQFDKPPIVPVAPIMGYYAVAKAQQSMNSISWHSDLMANIVLNSFKRFHYDLCCPISDISIGVESMGSQVQFHENKQPEVIDYAIKKWSDVNRIKIPEPMQQQRMAVIIECEKILKDKIGDQVEIGGFTPGVLSFAANLRNPQNIYYDVIDHPEFMHDLLKVSLEFLERFIESQIFHGGVNIIQIFDPLINLIQESMIEEFCISYLASLIQHIKTCGSKVWLITSKDSLRMINSYIELGVDILGVNELTDLVLAQQLINNRIILAGNVAAEHFVIHQPEEIFAESCRCIEQAATGGNFILSSSAEIPVYSLEENIDAMICAAHEFGSDFIDFKQQCK